jgi:hypothetical protein
VNFHYRTTFPQQIDTSSSPIPDSLKLNNQKNHINSCVTKQIFFIDDKNNQARFTPLDRGNLPSRFNAFRLVGKNKPGPGNPGLPT